MISADDNPGLFYFMVGMVVLVMAGVGLSIMIDKRFSFSKGSNEMREDLVSGSNEMAELTGDSPAFIRQIEIGTSGAPHKHDGAAEHAHVRDLAVEAARLSMH